MLGNSSSGIMEAASFALPVVNVGLRQYGRERARNVLDAEPNTRLHPRTNRHRAKRRRSATPCAA